MRRLFRLRSAAAAALAAALLGAGAIGLASHQSTASAGEKSVNLVGNGGFEWAPEFRAVAWQCTRAMRVPPGQEHSEFVNLMPGWDGEPRPSASAAPSTRPAPKPSSTPRQATVAGVAQAQPASTDDEGFHGSYLRGEPTAKDRAECTQDVPVRPRSSYTLSAWVRSGTAVLSTRFGSVTARGTDDWRKITTRFRTTATTTTVTIHLHGVYNSPKLVMFDDVRLVGPPSSRLRPAPPAAIRSSDVTSRTALLTWASSPGATSYRVLRDGAPIADVTGTQFLVRGMLPSTDAVFTVLAVNPAGVSGRSRAARVTTLGASAAPPKLTCGVCGANATDRVGMVGYEFSPIEGDTDGYLVYVDGVRVGWAMLTNVAVPGVGPGTHILQFSALNSAGESARSDPTSVVVEGR